MDTWSSTPKSQVDPETIEQAIARLIQAHDDDADSHLDTGQSLQSHKASEIIDHLAYSVVRDKLIFDRFTIDSDFQTVDCWLKTSDQWDNGYPNEVILSVDSVHDSIKFYMSPSDLLLDQAGFAMSPSWQINTRFIDPANADFWVGQFSYNIDAGIGFKVISGTLYCVWTDDGTFLTESLFSVEEASPYLLRVEYNASTSLAVFYVNGTLVHSVTIAVPSEYFLKYCMLYLNYNSGTQQNLWVSNFHFDCDYLPF